MRHVWPLRNSILCSLSVFWSKTRRFLFSSLPPFALQSNSTMDRTVALRQTSNISNWLLQLDFSFCTKTDLKIETQACTFHYVIQQNWNLICNPNPNNNFYSGKNIFSRDNGNLIMYHTIIVRKERSNVLDCTKNLILNVNYVLNASWMQKKKLNYL